MPRLLIIDDSASSRAAVRRMLEAAGHDVLEAYNGAEGIALLRREAIDGIITDIVMPEMDGFELIREVRANHPGLKILAMSAHAGGPINYLDLARRLGADGGLAKPFDESGLVLAISDMFGAQRPTGQD